MCGVCSLDVHDCDKNERGGGREREKLIIPGVILVMMEFVYSYLSALIAASMDDSTLSRLITSSSSSFSFCADFFAANQ